MQETEEAKMSGKLKHTTVRSSDPRRTWSIVAEDARTSSIQELHKWDGIHTKKQQRCRNGRKEEKSIRRSICERMRITAALGGHSYVTNTHTRMCEQHKR